MIPVKSYIFDFSNACNAGTSFLDTSRKKIKTKPFLFYGDECRSWRLGFSTSVDQQHCPDQDEEKNPQNLQEMSSQEKKKKKEADRNR